MNRESIITVAIALLIASTGANCKKTDQPPDVSQSAPSTSVARATSDSEITTASGDYKIIFTTEPHPIPLNEMFSIRVRVYDSSDAPVTPNDVSLSVDAAMPEHRHGMNTNPKVAVKEDDYVVTGMLFHMPGFWQIYFDLNRNGVTDRAQYDVNLD